MDCYDLLGQRVKECGRGGKRENPCRSDRSATFCSKLAFWWLKDLLGRGYWNILGVEDLGELPTEFEVDKISARFSQLWASERRKETPSLWKATILLVRRLLIINAVMNVWQVLQNLAPLLLQRVIHNLEGENYGACLSTIVQLTLLTIIVSCMRIHYRRFATNAEKIVTTALSTAVYQKSLYLKNISKGEVITLMSVDAQSVGELCLAYNLLWGYLLSYTAILVVVYHQVGVAVWAGVIICISIILAIMRLNETFRKYMNEVYEYREKRVNYLSEILSCISSIKFFAWEKLVKQKIDESRTKELKYLRIYLYMVAGIITFILTISTALTAGTISVYVWLGNDLTVTIVLPILFIYEIATFPTFDLPFLLSKVARGFASIKRLQNFLMMEEVMVLNRSLDKNQAGKIKITNGSFRHMQRKENDEQVEDKTHSKTNLLSDLSSQTIEDANVFTLSNVQLDFSSSQLIAIIGEVGAGKTSLMECILGELEMLNDFEGMKEKIQVKGKIAYAPQKPWIRNSSFKDNILCDMAFDRDHYDSVVESCCLKPDVAMLVAGDETEIGENGVNLSGGQKQRLSVARAVYRKAEINLFDDPFSAVDAGVGREMFMKCLSNEKGLLKGTIRMVITHHHHLLCMFDKIVVMENGRITFCGSWDQLRQLDIKCLSLTTTNNEKEHTSDDLDTMKLDTKTTEKYSIPTISDGKLISEEERDEGIVPWSVYREYFRGFGTPLFLVILFIISVFMHCSELTSRVWLTFWSAKESSSSNQNMHYLGIYVSIVLAYVVIVIVRHLLWYTGAWKSAKQLHNQMLTSVLNGSLSFFQSTPAGRILNRFSKDQQVLDQDLGDLISDCWISFFGVVRTVVFIVVLMPFLVVFFIPLFAVYWFVIMLFRSTRRELNRLEAIAASPLHANYGEMMDGLVSIRAHDLQSAMIEKNRKLVEVVLRTSYFNAMSELSLGLNTEVLASVMTFLTCTFALLCRSFNLVHDTTFLALAITFCLTISHGLDWFLRVFTRSEAEMVKVQRILTYIHQVKQERDVVCAVVDAQDDQSSVVHTSWKSQNWLKNGDITFQQVVLRYSPNLEPALRGISFHIRPGEKIGICGRTGAGKSSITLALFRLVEIESGTILIDGTDTGTIPLSTLRSQISIIPQEPVLLSGSVRSNLDPFNSSTDLEIWRCLEHTNMKQYISSLPNQLDEHLQTNGSNLSVGQKQLLCLARALIEKKKIVVLDEATASVDPTNDSKIQNVLAEAFKTSTLIIIAHRLQTIVHCDKIMLLECGRLVEFDSPHRLLQNKSSLFSRMVDNTGSQSSQKLRLTAMKTSLCL